MKIRWGYAFVACWIVSFASAVSTAPRSAPRPAPPLTARAQAIASTTPAAEAPSKRFVDTYCVTCHNQQLKTAGLTLDTLDLTDVGADAETWEKVVVKLRAGLMPPSGMPRPDASAIDSFTSSLEAALDRAAEPHPDPGRTEALHRLNRAEYKNAIRDLLALDVDVTTLLPHDEVSYGFDNIAGVLKLSPLLTE